MSIQANCPSCGGPVSFRFQTSVVNICSYCRTVVARTDRAFESLGKFPDLLQTESPLDLGMQGNLRGVPFELTGRAQIQHPAGGVWDEWYVSLADGRLGWLAEAQGKFYLTFEQQPAPGLPAYQQIGPGHPVPALGPGFVVAERNVGSMIAAKGEIPYKLVPNAPYYFADIAGPSGAFVTLDYSDGPIRMFAGREVSLAELGVAGKAPAARDPRMVKAKAMSCPNCGGSFELRAPDASMRVTCPYCRALSDVNQGNLVFLRVLTPSFTPDIPLGTQGTMEPSGPKMTVIGFVVRSVNFDGIAYPWVEYLLYEATVGFRWLVESDGHWSWVTGVSVADVSVSGATASYQRKAFKAFQYAFATYDHVEGEFYWKIEAGQSVVSTDYINPPAQLSCEATDTEVNWSIGDYKEVVEVERAFGVTLARKPVGVAPNQPFLPAQTYKFGFAFALLTFVIFLVHSVGCSPGDQVFSKQLALEPQRTAQDAQVFFLEGLQLSGKNLRIEASVPLSNSWAAIEGDLIELETGMVQPFELPLESYSGVEDGESWSEGSSNREIVLAAQPAGKYALRVQIQREKALTAGTMKLEVTEGVARPGRFILALFFLSFGPILALLWQYTFNKKRWENSDFNPYVPQEGGE